MLNLTEKLNKIIISSSLVPLLMINICSTNFVVSGLSVLLLLKHRVNQLGLKIEISELLCVFQIKVFFIAKMFKLKISKFLGKASAVKFILWSIIIIKHRRLLKNIAVDCIPRYPQEFSYFLESVDTRSNKEEEPFSSYDLF